MKRCPGFPPGRDGAARRDEPDRGQCRHRQDLHHCRALPAAHPGEGPVGARDSGGDLHGGGDGGIAPSHSSDLAKAARGLHCASERRSLPERAVEEARGPVSTILAARLRLALDGFDEAPIYTIHGFCQRVLKDRAFETGSLFDTELVTDQTPLLRQAVEDYWRRHFYRAGKLPVIFALKNGLSPRGTCCRWCAAAWLTRSSNCFHRWTGRTRHRWRRTLEGVFNALREVWREEKDEYPQPLRQRRQMGEQALQ